MINQMVIHNLFIGSCVIKSITQSQGILVFIKRRIVMKLVISKNISRNFWVLVLIIVCISGIILIRGIAGYGKESSKEVLSMSEVKKLAQKGNGLSWKDFEKYKEQDIGSGMYVVCYDIDKNYKLLIGGSDLKGKPDYIRLVKGTEEERYIDIRTGDIDKFMDSENS